MTQITPAKNYVLLKPVGSTPIKSGLVLPDAQDKKPELGIVYKIGKGTLPVPMKVGDTVVHKKYMSNEMDIPSLGMKLNPVAFEDIVAVITEGNK